ncbi:VPLPA-CTERM sorting domain-containing protein [Pseudoruegeria sp. SK021]|uniref:VPLPA-CTERM sorting domain-containing protein n=1 Tax=Pseudoruegeria sp. SK021 TaxID=1933035 RepID=UPI001F0B2B6A|nr:VPLPA-CTERM sorting domain-containing protein [Pseudoruegeria sp. SK021]
MQPAQAVTVGSNFDVETELLGLQVGNLLAVNLTLDQSGDALTAADPDVALAVAGVSLDLPILGETSVNLGILGVEWVDQNTFDLVFGLEGISLLGGLVELSLSVVPTVNWVLSDLVFDDPTAIITGVTQVNNGGIIVNPGGISWTDNSIAITTNSLINAGLNFDARSRFTMTTASPPAPVPLPAAGILLIGALGGLGAVRARRNRAC